MGYKRENLNKLKEKYDIEIKLEQDEDVTPGKIEVKPSKKYKEFKDDDEDVKV